MAAEDPRPEPHADPRELLALSGQTPHEPVTGAVRAHVQACSHCQEALDALATFQSLSDSAFGPPLPDEDPLRDDRVLLERLHATAAKELSTARPLATAPRRFGLPHSLAAAALVVLGVLTWQSFHAPRASSSPSAEYLLRREAGDRRARTSRSLGIELHLSAPTFVCVFDVAASGTAAVLWNDAGLRDLGLPVPLPPSEHRLPPDPLLDAELDGDPHVILVLLGDEVLSTPERDRLLAALELAAQSAPTDRTEALRRALAAPGRTVLLFEEGRQ